jgi:hypothetical protein
MLVPPRACSPRTPATAPVSPDYAAPISEWLSGSAAAWTEVLAALTPAERATIVATMRAYEAALDKPASTPLPGC